MMHKASCTAIAWLGLTSLDVRAARMDDRGSATMQFKTTIDASELDQINPHAGVYKIEAPPVEGLTKITDKVAVTVTCTDNFVFKDGNFGLSLQVPLELKGLKESCPELKGAAVMHANTLKFTLDAIAFQDSVAFGMMDTNKNEKLGKQEIMSALEFFIGFAMYPKEQVAASLELVIKKVDNDEDGEMSKKEISAATDYLMKLMDPQFLISELADQLFEILDKDGNDKISKQELQTAEVLKSYLPPGGPINVELILIEADKNKDEHVSKAEFNSVVDIVKKLQADPASWLDLVTPETLFSFLDSDKNDAISKDEFLILLEGMPEGDGKANLKTVLETLFVNADQEKGGKKDGVLDKQEIRDAIPALKNIITELDKNPYPYMPENKFCFSKVDDNLRVHAFSEQIPENQPQAPPVSLKLQKKGCNGAPRSAGLAVFFLLVARFIAF